MPPTITVLMAAYNGSRFIRDTIDTVIAQTMPDWELIVVDDCSRDDTPAIVAAIDDPRVRLVHAERNGGPAIARTIGMAHARGRFVAGLDQDDLCRPDRFEKQLAYLDEHPDVVLVASTIETFGDGAIRPDTHIDLVESDHIDWLMLMLNPLAWSTVMMRGEAARALQPFERDSVRFAEDFDLYQRIRAHGRIGRIAEPLLRYRAHPGGASQAYEEGMIVSAAMVLVERYRPLFGDKAGEAAMLMSRHASANHVAPDSATLARCGEVLSTLLDAHGGLAPGFAEASASQIWWKIARIGLRAGRYGMVEVIRARPAFAHRAEAASLGAMEDAAIGVTRRLTRRHA